MVPALSSINKFTYSFLNEKPKFASKFVTPGTKSPFSRAASVQTMATAVEAKPAAEAVPAVAAAEKSPVEKVIVHPLVLLSVVDHFNRMGKVGHSKRVMGLLLGSWSSKGVLDISNREPAQ